MKRISLIIERGDAIFFGRIYFNGNLIVEEAETLEKLEVNIKKNLSKFYGINPESILFDHQYDLSALFEKFDYLKISKIADIAGVNASLLRQYVTGKKNASITQAKRIEATIRQLGKELSEIKVHSK